MDFLSGNFCLTVFESNMDMIGYIAAIFIIKLFELAQSWTLACISSFASSLQVVDRECCT